MGKKEKLYKKAKNAPENFAFNDLKALVKHIGYKERKKTGSSHIIYKHDSIPDLINLQPDKGDKSKAKPYQVRKVLSIIEDNNLLDE